MTDHLPPPTADDDDDELPPCVGARLMRDAGTYAARQYQAAQETDDSKECC